MTFESFISANNFGGKAPQRVIVKGAHQKKLPEKKIRPRRNAKAHRKRLIYVADTESTTDPNDCRVWAWGIVNVETPEYDKVEIGTDIESFIKRIEGEHCVIYFHNLKWDGHFILDYLFKQGYRHVLTETLNHPRTMKSLVSIMGKFYSISVKWDNGTIVEFRDSLKKLPMTVKRIAKSFGMEESKGEIEYEAHREVGHIITPEEEDYLRRDVVIVAKAMSEVLAEGMKKLTIGSDSLSEYKRIIGPESFTKLFPVLPPNIDKEIRRAYRGGFTYADDRFSGRIVGSGLVLDVNSLYPSVMQNRILPYGTPEFVDGRPKLDKNHPLSIFSVTLTAKIKENHIPCLQIKGTNQFVATEYLREIIEPTTIMVTNVDFDLLNDHYDLDIYEYGGGWLFRGTTGLFDAYIDKWGKIKQESTGGKREIAKLHLNSLYGKFASNPNVTGKVPYLEDDKVKFKMGPNNTKDPVYTAVGVFITSWARDLTIRAAQENYDCFAYADTDSLHLLTNEIPNTIEVHPTKLGAWKHEYNFQEAIYIRPKAYVEKLTDGNFVTHIAGLPENVTKDLTFDDIYDGNIFHGKLTPVSVPGGLVLVDTPFQLKF